MFSFTLSTFLRICLFHLISLVLFLPGTASAVNLNLTFQSSFVLVASGGEGVSFDDATGNLFVAISSSDIEVYSTAGVFVSTIDVSGVISDGVRGIERLPNGNLLLTADERVVEVDGSGAAVGAGIDFTIGGASFRGVQFVASRNSIFASGEDGNSVDSITEFSPTGTVLNNFTLPSAGDYEGIALTPSGLNLLLADDSNDQLIEFDFSGNEIGTYDLNAITGIDTDPEGISTTSSAIYVSSDGGDLDGVLVFGFSQVPEPSTSLLLLAGMVLLLASRIRGWHRQSAGGDVAYESI